MTKRLLPASHRVGFEEEASRSRSGPHVDMTGTPTSASAATTTTASLPPLSCCVVTANLGTAGEDPSGEVLKEWLQDLKTLRDANHVDVLCIHLQEIGGKQYARGYSENLERDVNATLSVEDGWSSGLFWNGTHDDKFTGVGAMLYVSKRAQGRVFLGDTRGDGMGGSAERDQHPPECVEGLIPVKGRHFRCGKFVDAGRSRKGWVLYNLVVDKRQCNHVSTHLYHDDDNRITCLSASDTQYAQRRTVALREALAETNSKNLLIGGDLNFRVDGNSFVECVKKHKPDAVVTVGQKKFCWGNSQGEVNDLYGTEWADFQSSCKEGAMTREAISKELQVDLGELPVGFPPTYPLVSPSTPSERGTYSTKRLPAWCDRILFTPSPYHQGMRYSSVLTSLDHRMVLLQWNTTESN